MLGHLEDSAAALMRAALHSESSVGDFETTPKGPGVLGRNLRQTQPSAGDGLTRAGST